MNVELTKQIEINAAHHQPGYDGKCANVHGHNYVVELTYVGTMVRLDDLDECGMLMDFGDMKKHLERVVGVFDHTNLNDYYSTPSIEVIAMDWLQKLYDINPGYQKLRVYETSRSWVEVTNP